MAEGSERVNESILLIGATGGTGRAVLRQGLARGLRITALVRDPARLTDHDNRLRVVPGDLLRRDSLDPAFAPRPAVVICAAGVYSRRPDDRLSRGTANLLDAMQSAGTPRLVCVSSLGAGDSAGQGNLPARLIQRLFLSEVLADKTRQEALIRASGLDWTIFRPPQLTNAPDRGPALVCWTGNAPGQPVNWRLSRATLARLLLDEALSPRYSGRALNLSEAA
ncbi:MAG: SDR family oxidoreductase [Gammaproteobacteria bacterium]|nr:MAG: SDR family oxidoreductase [Gammaproteobacteria bacterium]